MITKNFLQTSNTTQNHAELNLARSPTRPVERTGIELINGCRRIIPRLALGGCGLGKNRNIKIIGLGLFLGLLSRFV